MAEPKLSAEALAAIERAAAELIMRQRFHGGATQEAVARVAIVEFVGPLIEQYEKQLRMECDHC